MRVSCHMPASRTCPPHTYLTGPLRTPTSYTHTPTQIPHKHSHFTHLTHAPTSYTYFIHTYLIYIYTPYTRPPHIYISHMPLSALSLSLTHTHMHTHTSYHHTTHPCPLNTHLTPTHITYAYRTHTSHAPTLHACQCLSDKWQSQLVLALKETYSDCTSIVPAGAECSWASCGPRIRSPDPLRPRAHTSWVSTATCDSKASKLLL